MSRVNARANRKELNVDVYDFPDQDPDDKLEGKTWENPTISIHFIVIHRGEL